jgi:hypothetical protein
MKNNEGKFTTNVEVSIFCGTWNVNAKKQEGRLHEWLLPSDGRGDLPDVYAIGFQEIVDLNAMNVAINSGGTQKMAQFWKEKATEGGFAVHRRGAYTFMDMNPINTRTTDRNYLQNQQYVADANQLGQNPYFERFDVVTDPFNVARELRATVYEDKVDRGLLESKRLLNRIYTTRYKAPDYAEKNSLDTLNSYEDLRPRLNTMEKTYRPYKN